jgi:[ribosomal protein S18]-alanine N-acetyltransferase
MSAILQCIGTRIREFMIGDLDSMVEIDRSMFVDPFSDREFIRFLRSERVICTVIERNRKILGYCLYEQFAGYSLIRRIAVAQKHCGYGRQLVSGVKRHMLKENKSFVDCRIPEENLDAQLFFQANGFTAIDVIPTDDSSEYLFRHLRGQQ